MSTCTKLAALAVCIAAMLGDVHAFPLGPSHYLSFSDSPFHGKTFGYFCLEDFEDGLLNTPGVTISQGHVFVTGYGPTSDSVDADDGVIDGNALGYANYYSANRKTQSAHTLTFSFSKSMLGELPTHVGVVWTDVSGGPYNHYGYIWTAAFGEGGEPLGTSGPHWVGDGWDGTYNATAEDRFFGWEEQGGISGFTVSMEWGFWTVDHLQYGYRRAGITDIPPIPEPESLCLFATIIAALGVQRRRERRRTMNRQRAKVLRSGLIQAAIGLIVMEALVVVTMVSIWHDDDIMGPLRMLCEQHPPLDMVLFAVYVLATACAMMIPCALSCIGYGDYLREKAPELLEPELPFLP